MPSNTPSSLHSSANNHSFPSCLPFPTLLRFYDWWSINHLSPKIGVNMWSRWRREWQPILVILPGEFHGQRSLESYSPWGCKELDTTEWLTHTHTHTHTQWFRSDQSQAGGEGDDRGWDGWMASLTQWTWVWVNSGSWWWTGKPGMLQSMGSQRVRHDWATELDWLNHSISTNCLLWLVQG